MRDDLVRRTLRLVLSVACERALPQKRLVGGYSLGKGYWYRFDGEVGPVSQEDAERIRSEMQALIELKAPIVSSEKDFSFAVDYFSKTKQFFAARLLEKRVPLDGIVKVSATPLCATFQRSIHSPACSTPHY